MDLIVTFLIGVAIGAMVELLIPGHRRSEVALAMLLGAAGAVLARFLGGLGDWFDVDGSESYVASAFGAVVVLLSYAKENRNIK
jgi:uncharacterized membrane protein YeaQ/YmgE (transglycosylase-associated protein family)